MTENYGYFTWCHFAETDNDIPKILKFILNFF